MLLKKKIIGGKMKYLHAMIRVNDIDKSLKFYEDLIGLRLQDKKELEDCELYFLANAQGEPEIELTRNFDTPAEGYKNGNTFGHFAFATDDMSAFETKVKNLGYEFLYEPYEIKLKSSSGAEEIKKIAFLKDPDENEIEIIQK